MSRVADRDEPKRQWVRSLPCIASQKHDCILVYPEPRRFGPWLRSRLCHRKHGSKKSDREIFPGCDQLHAEHHAKGEKWLNLKYGIDLGLICAEIHQIWEKRR